MTGAAPVGPSGRFALDGFGALFHKEMLRFWKVGVQTVAAPVMTALMYLLIFSHALPAGSRCSTESTTPRSSSRAW